MTVTFIYFFIIVLQLWQISTLSPPHVLTNLLCKYDVFSWGLHVLPNNQWWVWGHGGTLSTRILGANTGQNSLHISTLYLGHSPHNSVKRHHSLHLHQVAMEWVWITWQAPQYVTVTARSCYQQQVPCTDSSPVENRQGMSSPTCSLCLSVQPTEYTATAMEVHKTHCNYITVLLKRNSIHSKHSIFQSALQDTN